MPRPFKDHLEDPEEEDVDRLANPENRVFQETPALQGKQVPEVTPVTPALQDPKAQQENQVLEDTRAREE